MQYKLRHIPTGLYFRPKDGGANNLSTKGKIYETNWMYNQLTDFNRINLITLMHGKGRGKIPPLEYEIGQAIHRGEYPELNVKLDWTDNEYAWVDILTAPNDWEKEYVNVKIEVIGK